MNLHQHYRDVRSRLMNPATAIADVQPPPVVKIEPPAPIEAIEDRPPLPKIAEGVPVITMPVRKRPRIRCLVNMAAAKYGVTRAAILSTTRRQPQALARQEVMYRAVEAGYSLGEVGAALDRDHTSVLYGHNRFKVLLEAGKVSL